MKKKVPLKSCNILGTDIAVTNMPEAVGRLSEGLEDYRGDYMVLPMEEKRLSSGENFALQTLQRSCPLEPLFL